MKIQLFKNLKADRPTDVNRSIKNDTIRYFRMLRKLTKLLPWKGKFYLSNDMNYTLMEIERLRFCHAIPWWKNVDGMTTRFAMELFLRQCVRRVAKNEGRPKAICPSPSLSMQVLRFVFGHIHIVQYIENKNRPALGYALNCPERRRFRVENVTFFSLSLSLSLSGWFGEVV